jgi:hypothetical protein
MIIRKKFDPNKAPKTIYQKAMQARILEEIKNDNGEELKKLVEKRRAKNDRDKIQS